MHPELISLESTLTSHSHWSDPTADREWFRHEEPLISHIKRLREAAA